jgi:hypothetical protein
MLGLGGDSTELYINDQNIIRERDVVVDWKMPVTGGLMLKNTAVDRIILEAEYISDRIDTKYQTNSKHVKDVLGAFYIEKILPIVSPYLLVAIVLEVQKTGSSMVI